MDMDIITILLKLLINMFYNDLKYIRNRIKLHKKNGNKKEKKVF